MNIEELDLSTHEYCSEENGRTVRGQLPSPVDLETLRKRAGEISPKVIFMKRLGVLVVILGTVTVHVDQAGKIAVNGVKSIEEAGKILSGLLTEKSEE